MSFVAKKRKEEKEKNKEKNKEKDNQKTTKKHKGQRKVGLEEMFGCQKHPRVVAHQYS